MPVNRHVRVLLSALLLAACTASPASIPPPAPTATPTRAPTSVPTSGPSAPTAAPTTRSLYDEEADPRVDIAAALSAARDDGKRVLLDFGADWCPDCHVLAAYLDGPEGKALMDEHFHLVSIDVGFWDANLDVVEEYGNAIWAGIPAVVALEADGWIAGALDGGEVAGASQMSQSDVLEQIAKLAK